MDSLTVFFPAAVGLASLAEAAASFAGVFTSYRDKAGQKTELHITFLGQRKLENHSFYNLERQKIYVPSWSWKSLSPKNLRYSAEQLTERPSLTDGRRTGLWDVWRRLPAGWRSLSSQLDRSRSQTEPPDSLK